MWSSNEYAMVTRAGRPIKVWTMLVVGIVLITAAASVAWSFLVREVKRYEVSGTVLRQGQAIAMPEFVIVFTNRETKRIGVGVLDEQGRYRVHTYHESGLPAGKYDVVISFPQGYMLSQEQLTSERNVEDVLEEKLAKFVPKKYRDPKTSGLTLTIVDRDVTFDVDMRE